ncbi:MAG TPA: TRAP transporter TatT component family protein [Thermoanaerobaculia bacterium]
MRLSRLTLPLLAAMALAGCSIRGLAVRSVANALSAGGGVFAEDDDPELVRDAIPFGLKTYESLLREVPEHRGLLLATASGFIQYAYAFVQQDADFAEADDLARAREMRARAKRLFLRGRDYAFRGLEVRHPGFAEAVRGDPEAALAATTREDVPFLYWAGAGWLAALMASKEDLGLVADLPAAAALVERVLELDERFAGGAAHELLISYEGSRSAAMGGSAERAREHYRRALALSGGRRASVHLALAEAVSVNEQNLGEFQSLVAAALAIDPAADPEQRLVNVLAQRRARWLEARLPDLFLEAAPPEDEP